MIRLIAGTSMILLPTWLGAASASDPGFGGATPVPFMLSLAILAIGAFLLMMVSSFVKVSVVLSILRNAIGTQQIPPSPVINGLALVLTFYIMAPVLDDAMKRSGMMGSDGRVAVVDSERLLDGFDRAREPVREFLVRHAHESDVRFMYELANQLQGLPANSHELDPHRFQVLIPAFVTSELSEAFLIGFLVFLPFLIIDLVVANILMGMGMTMMSPTAVSLPFKLLLFVLTSGWSTLVRVLATDYLPHP